MKAYRHADGSVWTFRPEANAARFARSRPPPGAARAARGRLHRVAARSSSPSTRPGCRPATRGRRASTCARSCSPPRCSSACARRSEVTYSRHRLAGRRLLPRRRQAGDAVDLDRLRPRRRGRHRRGQVRRQLRRARWPASWRASSTAATRPCSSTPRRTRYIEELGGHEPLPRHQGRPHRHARADRHDPRGRHPRLDPRARQGARPRARGAPHPDRGVEGGRGDGDIVEVFACGTAAVVTPVGELRWDGGSRRPPPRGPRGPLRRGDPRQRCSTSSTAAPRTPAAG